MYPRLEINLSKLQNNVKVLNNMCKAQNIDIAIVTKSFCANTKIVEAICKEDISYLADSRISNLKKMKDFAPQKILIRIPMISEAKEVVEYADISFNSEIETILQLEQECLRQDKTHKVVIMVDLGDLREGYFNENEIYNAIEIIQKLKKIKLIGIATNLTCYGAIIPTPTNLNRLVEISNNIKEKYSIDLEIISGGNSSSIHLVENKQMPKEINNLRLGEVVLLGKETAYGQKVNNCENDAFKLVCEVIEIKNKPSLPIGEIGVDAFGNKPHYEDKGIRKRAIIAIGKQDIVDNTSIKPVDKDIEILGSSSDHMILDITNSQKTYQIGSKVEFTLTYGSILSTCTSEYVEKFFI